MSDNPPPFSDRLDKVLSQANLEAQRFSNEYIGTEHLLLALIRDVCRAVSIIKSMGVDTRKIRLEVEKLIESGPDMVTMGRLPITPGANKAIAFATEEASSMDSDQTRTEHLLLGLIREEESIASQVLVSLGVTYNKVLVGITMQKAKEMVQGTPAEQLIPEQQMIKLPVQQLVFSPVPFWLLFAKRLALYIVLGTLIFPFLMIHFNNIVFYIIAATLPMCMFIVVNHLVPQKVLSINNYEQSEDPKNNH